MSTSAEAKPKSIAVILEHLDDKAPIPKFVGKLTKLYPAKQSKPGDEKQWCIQNGELTDPAGHTIPVMFKDRPPMEVKSWQNKQVILTCNDGEKGTTGVWVFDDEYNGSITRKIKVTPTGHIDYADGSEQPAPAEQQQRPATQQAQPSGQHATTRQNQTQRKAAPAGGMKEARRVIAQVAALHDVCLDAAVNQAAKFHRRHGYAVLPMTVIIWADKFLMESIRRTSVDSLPFDAYAEKPYAGVRLDEFLPVMEGQIAASKARNAELQAETMGEHQTTPAAAEVQQRMPQAMTPQREREYIADMEARQRAQQQQRPAPRQQPAAPVEPPPEESFHDNMEDDDIPF